MCITAYLTQYTMHALAQNIDLKLTAKVFTLKS